jgi:hypothetical protein
LCHEQQFADYGPAMPGRQVDRAGGRSELWRHITGDFCVQLAVSCQDYQAAQAENAQTPPQGEPARACRSATPPALRLKPSRLILVAGIGQYHPDHIAGVPDGEPACDDPADRVANQHEWRADAGTGQALPEFIGHVVEGSPAARRRVAPPETCPIVHAYPHLPGELALKSQEVQHIPADGGDDDHRRRAAAHVE